MTIPAPTEGLCLEFVNTRYWRGSENPTETLNDARALAGFLGGPCGLPEACVAELAARADGDADASRRLLDDAVALRETIHRLLVAHASGDRASESDLEVFNAALARAPRREALVPGGSGFRWRVPRGPLDAPSLLAPVLWSAADLLVGGDPGRIRQCANEKCRWLFVDRSRSGARRWCDMASCGNRAKAHRHYRKRKSAVP